MTKKQEAICSECGWTSKDMVGLTNCPECKAELIYMEDAKPAGKTDQEKYPGEVVQKVEESESDIDQLVKDDNL
ncbi:MAG: hypothetical protein HW405_917 [Candidatus Berkelbacteria bacterium]|nr:hypothetical protein [Candidatus Berkelbacteria bacterium]